MKRKNTIALCVTLATLLLFSACGSQSKPTEDTNQSSTGYSHTTEELEKAIYNITEEENKNNFKDSNKLTCIMIAKGSGNSKDTYFELTIPKEFVDGDIKMPYYATQGISLPIIVNNNSNDYTLFISFKEYPDMTNLEELITANMPTALNREIVSAPYGNDASYKAIYDEKDSNNPWQKTRHGLKYLKRDSDNTEKDIIVSMHADFGSYTSLEIDDIYKILDGVEIKQLDHYETENLINEYMSEVLGYDINTVVQIPYAISSVLNSSYRRDTDRKNVNWTVKELREVTNITLKDYRYDEYDNYVLTESDKDWIQYLTCVTSVTIEGAADISNIDFIRGLSSIQNLYIRDCNSLTDVSAIEELSSLQTIYIRDCDNLTDISAIQDLQYLEEITFYDCDNLTNITAIQDLPSLRALRIDSCDSLTNIGSIQDLPSLQNISITGSTVYTADGFYVNYGNLVIDMEDILNFTSIQILTIDCTEIKNTELINTLPTLPNILAYSIRTPNERYEWSSL